MGIIVSSAETIGALNSGFEPVNLHRPTLVFGGAMTLIITSSRSCDQGLHSFTSQLNLSAFCGIGGARRGAVARVKGMFRGVKGV